MNSAEEIINFINDELLDETIEINNETSLFQDKIIDSLNLVRLIDFLEEKFEIKIKTSEVSLENLDSVGKMIAFIKRKTS